MSPAESETFKSTAYAGLGRAAALGILLLCAIAIVWLILATMREPRPAGEAYQGGNDLQLYRKIIERVHAGEGYYDAAGIELRAQGYPTGSPFNWRLPTYAWFLGAMPGLASGQISLSLIALITLVLAWRLLLREGGPWQAVTGCLLLFGAFYWCVDGDAFLAQELWAGTLLTLSVVCYASGSWQGGCIAGIAALLIRELVMPYALLCLFLSIWKKRWADAAVWTAGIALFAVFLFYHVAEVRRHITPEDRQPGSWIQFGGAAFLIDTCRMNSFLFSLPGWMRALYLPLAVLGLASWRGETGVRMALTAVGYLAAFAVVGQPFNTYWGLMYAGLLPFGIARAPTSLRDLIKAARGHYNSQGTPV